MSRPGQAARPVRRAGVLASALVAVLMLPLVTDAGLVQLLPDLRMARPTDIRITTTASGRRQLRLTTTIANVGRGPFALVATRSSTSVTTMTVQQRIWRSDGTTRYVLTRGLARYAGDGHDHWHITRVATYELIDGRDGSVRRDSKVGFCFFDTGIYDRSLPGFRALRRYFETGCGGRSSLRATMGISVGWGDTYGSGLAFQWIDVTGVPGGTYWIVATADKANLYQESNEANNCSWAKVRLASGAAAVSTVDRGQGCIPPGVVAPSQSPSPSVSPSVAPSAAPSASASASPGGDPLSDAPG